ncbi:hypothetical protein ACFFTU_02540 [Streptomyces cremeus]|uniref:ABC transmembrane type-1 domain-containing protein n=1 Tax=Streptomyces cremeus TaxID=66881 RepID=A0ABV5P6R8_STRCM
MSVVAHLLAPFVAASVTPLTVVVLMLAFNWQMGLAALAAVPLVAAVQTWTARASTDTDVKTTDRVVEYLRAQPVLRAGGRTAERFALLDDSLARIQRATRRPARRRGSGRHRAARPHRACSPWAPTWRSAAASASPRSCRSWCSPSAAPTRSSPSPTSAAGSALPAPC